MTWPRLKRGRFSTPAKTETTWIFLTFSLPTKLETEGRWVPLGKDAEVLVARTGNDKFNAKTGIC